MPGRACRLFFASIGLTNGYGLRQMVEINPRTGTVIWGEFVIEVRTLRDELLNRYPQVSSSTSPVTRIGLTWAANYHLNEQLIEGEPSVAFLTFANQHPAVINIVPAYEDLDLDTEEAQSLWWHKMDRWINAAHKWLRSQLGEPNEITHASLYDEEEMFPAEFVQLLQRNWRYTFRWGEAGLSYESLDMAIGIYITYDTFAQITTWDELAAECDTRISNEQAANGMYVSHLVATRSLIDILRPNFEFQEVKPRIHLGLFFEPPALKTKIVVDVRPDSNSKRYVIWRHDTTRKSFIAEGDSSHLVEELRLFLKTEKM